MPRPFVWMVWTVALWTSGRGLILQQDAGILYPALLSKESIDCNCGSFPCASVHWYRVTSSSSEVQYLGKNNFANKPSYEKDVDGSKFQFGVRSSSTFTLTITNLTKEDTGTYFCFLGGRKVEQAKWNSGVLLLPGVPPPTPPPATTPPKKIIMHCDCSKNRSQDGCGSLILWPLIGLIAAITVALVCTLYYFSRLPKKCRHHFTKTRFMT